MFRSIRTILRELVGANIKIFESYVSTFLCLIKSAFVGKKNFERYQNARYNNKNTTVSFFILKPIQKWNRPRSGTVKKKTDVFKIPRAVFMGGCSYLGLRTQNKLENHNPVLTDP
jgi:hypothetical protein